MKTADIIQPDHPLEESRCWRGTLDVHFANIREKTFPTKSHTTSPLRIQRPFYPAAAPGNCQSVIVHTAGGMVGGDRLDMAITAAANTQVLLTTAAAHKIYRSQGDWAQQAIQLSVKSGAYVEWLPQELILFNGGRFQQTISVELEPGGVWLGWDVTRFGRSARGETLETGEWRSQTEVWQQGSPLWIDRQRLTGGSEVLNTYHGLAGCPVIGTFLILGLSVSAQHLSHLRTLLDARGEFGITQLEQGLVARYRGSSSQMARQVFIYIWQYLRTELLEQNAYIPRVWGV